MTMHVGMVAMILDVDLFPTRAVYRRVLDASEIQAHFRTGRCSFSRDNACSIVGGGR